MQGNILYIFYNIYIYIKIKNVMSQNAKTNIKRKRLMCVCVFCINREKENKKEIVGRD